MRIMEVTNLKQKNIIASTITNDTKIVILSAYGVNAVTGADPQSQECKKLNASLRTPILYLTYKSKQLILITRV